MQAISFFRLSDRLSLFGFLVAATFLAHAATADDQPNFIIVMTDDQGWGDAGYAGL